jgi:hypothetical protein
VFILALDIATRCGLCAGQAGDIPRPSFFLTRQEMSPPHFSAAGLGTWLRDYFEERRRPDLLIVERAALPTWQSNVNEVIAAQQAHGAARALAACYNVDFADPDVRTVRKLFCGRGTAPKRIEGVPEDRRGGKSAAKNMVIDQAIARGFLEEDDRDDDKADAAALFYFGSVTYGNTVPHRR